MDSDQLQFKIKIGPYLKLSYLVLQEAARKTKGPLSCEELSKSY